MSRVGLLRVMYFGPEVIRMAEDSTTETFQVVRKTPPVSRTLRLLTGSWLLFEVAVNIKGPDWKAALFVSCTFVAVFIYYALLHRLIGQRVLKWEVAKAVTILPLVVVFFTVHGAGILPGVFAFFGVSLVVQALRGDRGCEVMTLPTLLFRRRAHLPCLLFSPIDRFEEWIYRSIRGH